MNKSIPIPKLICNHPDELQDQFYSVLREVSHYQRTKNHITINQKLVRMVCSWLDTAIGRANRLDFLSKCFGRTILSSSDLTEPEAFGLLLWCNPWKPDAPEDAKWMGGDNWVRDITLLRKHYGQLELVL